VVGVAAVAVIVASGCATGPQAAQSSSSQSAVVTNDSPCSPTWTAADGWTCTGTGAIVDVTVKNFAIQLPSVIPTGRVTFRVHGDGPTLHEFNVARSDLGPRDLPLAEDDTVNDGQNTSRFFWVGQVEGIDIGMTKTFTTNITAGHYDFYCNMDGHYMAGMSAQAEAI
jgi:hypothetical protein